MLAILVVVVVGGGIGNLYQTGVDGILAAFHGNVSPPPSEPEPTPTPEPSLLCVEEILDQSGGSNCEQHEFCLHIEPGDIEGCADFNNCTINIGTDPGVVVVKAGKDYQIYIEDPTVGFYSWTGDGCYYVSYSGGYLTWSKLGTGSHCKDASHIQAWEYDNVMVCEEE